MLFTSLHNKLDVVISEMFVRDKELSQYSIIAMSYDVIHPQCHMFTFVGNYTGYIITSLWAKKLA